jgi:hypothetical protein
MWLTRAVQLILRRRLLRVCRKWKEALESMPTLWRELLIEGRPDLSDAALRACVQRSEGNLRALSLSLMNSVQFATNRACLGACKELVFLELPSGLEERHIFRVVPHLQKLICLKLDLQIRIDSIGLALSRLPHLEYVEFLDVKPCSFVDTWMGANLPKLRVFRIGTSSRDRWHPLSLVCIPGDTRLTHLLTFIGWYFPGDTQS